MKFIGSWMLAIGMLLGSAANAAPPPQELLYFVAREQLRRVDIDTIDHPPLVEDTLIGSTGDDEHAVPGPDGGGNVNGTMCFLPGGRMVMGEDAGQTKIPAGWAVFEPNGRMIGKLVTTAFDFPEPAGCAVDAQGRLFTVEVGTETISGGNGQLILWFPPYDRFPGPDPYPNADYSTNYCKLAIDIGTATNVAIDEQGRILVTSPRSGTVVRFSGPLPTSNDAQGGCGRIDSTGAHLVDAGRLTRESFIRSAKIGTPSGLARAPNGGWYVGDVLFGRIGEFDASGAFVRYVMDSGAFTGLPTQYGSPQSIAVDSQGRVYYADLALEGTIFDHDTGSDGKVWRIRFDASGDPLPPEIIVSGLGFPDGVAVRPGNLEATEWRTLGGSQERKYFNPTESTLTPDNVGQLVTRWEFPTTAIVTDSPSVASIALPGEGRQSLVFFSDWNGLVYAVRLADGTQLWSFQADQQPGANYPGASSAHVETVDGEDRVFIAYGETMYALDAATGAELWRFTAGTGCKDAQGNAPGSCGFQGERNEIESTAAIADGTVFFAMDTNDSTLGKGGFYGVDVHSGHLRWFFDFASLSTCRPDPGDAVTRFDGYHSAAELGLPADFFATRSGCGFDRTPNGCGNVWSSAAIDPARGLLYSVTSNCDVDDDPTTPKPPPPMPPYDEAIFALHLDGTPAWRWRPREVDTNDFDFGAVPNLFTITVGGAARDVLGVGSKDGTYYVLDRDGVNEVNGVAWNDADPKDLPYWKTQVVPGGDIGGIIASAAADEQRRRIYFSTAPGLDVFHPQRPTVHALDMDTGAVVWDNGTTGPFSDASYAPTSATPGLVFTGSVLSPSLRIWNADSGALLYNQIIASPGLANAIAGAATVVDGTVIVGTGIGTRSGDPHDLGDTISRAPRALVALCVPGTRGCGACQNGVDDDHDGTTDWPEDPGCDSPDDTSEKSDTIACDDGIDNDGDGEIDMLDAGCPFPAATTESTQCDDGIDENGDGLVDFDDPNCSRAWPYWEVAPPGCGLGAELVLVLPLLRAPRRRRR